MAAPLLTLHNIVVRYGRATALQIDCLELNPGELLAILGPNGAGKSTLLRVMSLLQPLSEGSIAFRGIATDQHNALALRRRIAMVFPEPLLVQESVYGNAGLGLRLRGLNRSEISRRLEPWLDRLGIAHLSNRAARTLSSGEAQRVSLARALVLEPELLLLDEPFSSLDPSGRESLLRDFQRAVRESGVTTVFVTHDRNEALALADRIAVMVDGRVVQLGTRDEVFRRPVTEAVAAIVGVENRLHGALEKTEGSAVRFRIGSFLLPVAICAPANVSAILCIRAEDFYLSMRDGNSALADCLHGDITNVIAGKPFSYFYVNCQGIEIVAAATTQTCADDRLKEGAKVILRFDPAAVHIVFS